jgi:hypothetical protein
LQQTIENEPEPVSTIPLNSPTYVDLESIQGFTARLEYLEKCYESPCDFPESDPREYDFAVGKEIAYTINSLTAWVQANR